jgi:hypothetical protein
MAVSEKVAAITDVRFAFARRTAMDCHEFAKGIFVADFQIRSARRDILDPAFAGR